MTLVGFFVDNAYVEEMCVSAGGGVRVYAQGNP
jgi:hypothetical protein